MVRFKERRILAVTQFCCAGKQIKRANVVRRGKQEKNSNQLETGEEAGVYIEGCFSPFPYPGLLSFSFSSLANLI